MHDEVINQRRQVIAQVLRDASEALGALLQHDDPCATTVITPGHDEEESIDTKNGLCRMPPEPYWQSLVQWMPRILATASTTDTFVPPSAISNEWRVSTEVLLKEQLLSVLLTRMRKKQQRRPYVELFSAMDVVIVATEQAWFEAWTPLVFLEEILDMSTIISCQVWFRYLEARSSRLIARMPPRGGKSQALLRICNELLRKLTKTDDSAFLGRVMIFLANSFPLSDPSGVNQAGQFNMANVTHFDTTLPELDQDKQPAEEKQPDEDTQDTATASKDDEDDVEKKKSKSIDEENRALVKDPEFYRLFWSLQRYFNQPTLLFEQSEFDTFTASIESVLSCMESTIMAEHTVRDTSSSATDRRSARKRNRALKTLDPMQVDGQTGAAPAEPSTFYPKYLTSHNLLPLQMTSTWFQRPVMMQINITLNYLTTMLQEEKDKAEAIAKQKGRAPEYVLEGDQKLWVMRTRTRINDLLDRTSPNGHNFVGTARLVLRHEANWVRWKVMGCPPYDLLPVNVPQEALQQQELRATMDPGPFKYAMGSKALSRLWEKDVDDLTFIADPKRRFAMPSTREYLQNFNEEFPEPIAEGEPPNKRFFPDHIPEFTKETRLARMWRGYRLASDSHLSSVCTARYGDMAALSARMDQVDAASSLLEETSAPAVECEDPLLDDPEFEPDNDEAAEEADDDRASSVATEATDVTAKDASVEMNVITEPSHTVAAPDEDTEMAEGEEDTPATASPSQVDTAQQDDSAHAPDATASPAPETDAVMPDVDQEDGEAR